MSVGAMTGMISVEPKKGDRANLHRPLMTFIMGAFPEQQEVSGTFLAVLRHTLECAQRKIFYNRTFCQL